MEYTIQQLATKRRQIIQEYNEKLKELAEIKKRKAFKIIEIMAQPNIKSQKHAELVWETTEDGQKEITMVYHTKGLLELARSVKTEVDVKNGEAYNQY